ncbi:MAG TPA: glucose 1-dehydrogenase [Candidatus Eisenbacteria bacterium]|nr:glucose 1-dehydrogenase [Candidatus Eisenbacteria bacterium]
MKAVAVTPGKPRSAHLVDVPAPKLDEVPDGRGVLVRVLRVGVDGTDREIYDAEYGKAPPGFDYLVTGHESFGQIEQVGANVRDLAPGDFVVATVRRPGRSIYDAIGTSDMTTDDEYYERGINLRHGYLTERYVDDRRFIVHVPAALKQPAVLLEPLSIVEKGVAQAYEIQRRMKVWEPCRAAVTGAGSVGLLAAMALRLRGLEVTVLSRERKPSRNVELAEALGARYLSTQDGSVADAAGAHGPFDLMVEATGFSPLAFECMEALGKNGVLVLASVTGGDRQVTVPADRINLGFVLGNKVAVGTVNANRSYFEAGVRDMAMSEARWPGWLQRLLTHEVVGLERWQELYQRLTSPTGDIKVFLSLAPLP